MFSRLNNLLKNVKKLDKSKIFLEIINKREVQHYIISLNRIDQIFINGENSDGDELGTYEDETVFSKSGQVYSADRVFIDNEGFFRTDNVSKKINVDDTYILIDTGDLYDSYKVEVNGDSFSISANTLKKNKDNNTEDINVVYGNIVGLNDKSKEEFAESIIPLVVQEVRKVLLS